MRVRKLPKPHIFFSLALALVKNRSGEDDIFFKVSIQRMSTIEQDYCRETTKASIHEGNTISPTCAVNGAGTAQSGFRQRNNGKWYYCTCMSTELIRLSISLVDSHFCMYDN